MYLKICICVHILTHLYAKNKSLEVYKSNIDWLCLILGIKRKFHFIFLYFSNHGLTELKKNKIIYVIRLSQFKAFSKSLINCSYHHHSAEIYLEIQINMNTWFDYFKLVLD